MKVEFLSVAEREFTEAVEYYNQESEGLGFKFAAEVKRTLESIVQFPKAWMPLSERTRRCRTNRFKYGVIYQIREDKILIVAIMHLNRDPDSWKSRVSTP